MSGHWDREYFSCLALRHSPNIGPRTWKKILNHYGSAYEAVMDASNWTGKGLASAARARDFTRELWRAKAEEEYNRTRKLQPGVVTWFDPSYPKLLKNISDPPVCLYYLGDKSLLANPAVAVVGARRPYRESLLAAQRISMGLSRYSITVVSGMAYGIDRQAHLGGLAREGSSVAVLGSGIDVIYPEENKDLYQQLSGHGLVVSEYGPGTAPRAENFPRRNRIISGLSLAVVVVEATRKSGSLITARLGLEQGREVLAMPGSSLGSRFEGSNQLIKEGSPLVSSAEDVLWKIHSQLGVYPAVQEAVRDYLHSPEPKHEFDGNILLSIDLAPDAGPASALPPEEKSSGEEKASGDSSRAKESEREPVNEKSAESNCISGSGQAKVHGTQARILELVAERGKIHGDELARELDLAPQVVGAATLELEIKGLVKRLPGMYYTPGGG